MEVNKRFQSLVVGCFWAVCCCFTLVSCKGGYSSFKFYSSSNLDFKIFNSIDERKNFKHKKNTNQSPESDYLSSKELHGYM